MLLTLAVKSLLNRKFTVFLTIISIAVSVFVLLGVEHLKNESKNSFQKTVSGIDIIVGPRTGQINLLLYSVFGIGNPTNNVSWQSFQAMANSSSVDFAIPISLGDSHKSYRVLGTNQDYFRYFKHSQKKPLAFVQGQSFGQPFEAVLGFDVAKSLGYELANEIVLAHGTGAMSFSNHTDKPFIIVGILQPTGTPVDQTIYVSLESIEILHDSDLSAGHSHHQHNETDHVHEEHAISPDEITAFMLGLKSKAAAFSIQRAINNYPAEPLLAILPASTLTELWRLVGSIENILLIISVLVLFSSLFGLTTMLLAAQRERQRELAVLRAIGASPFFISILVQLEAILIVVVGIVIAVFANILVAFLAADFLSQQYGIFIGLDFFTVNTVTIIGTILLLTIFISLIPTISSYRSSLHNGLMVNQ